ncbi:hypothetical protein M758_1G168900 [Ceratodon purpureus]|uniref:MAU2 chromatid cohesion factor homolog n=1 Tax=Ceratodon purpureus TaxID=3225 RepID=A0A8T0J641_CERPU|nr:hypothetical protein KC19_1G172300 [Ceratodon purpureus]KAG0630309.1 hypothetical protein M758_1G168900 [Ceratodon purpureus]
MESIAEGLWQLAEQHEVGGCIAQAVKCLEAICQSQVSFLPVIEVKTRLRIATLLLQHTDNVTHAKAHLERAQLLLKQIPTCFELKFRAYSLLSRCYQLVGTIAAVKQTLKKGLELSMNVATGDAGRLWACNFSLQLAKALTTESDYPGALRVLESASKLAAAMNKPQLEMVFATARLHVQLMQWEEPPVIEQSLALCDQLFERIPQHLKRSHAGLHVYKELLYIFYLMRACEYKEGQERVTDLDTTLRELEQAVPVQQAVFDPVVYQELRNQLDWLIRELQLPGALPQRTADLQYHYGLIQQQLVQYEQLRNPVAQPQEDRNRLPLGPAPLDEEWIPKVAVLVLVDLMSVICSRPKGMFKDCTSRISSGLERVNGELQKLGITPQVTEADLQHWAMWTGGVYLLLLTQLLENKVVIELTEADYVEAQKSLVQLVEWKRRFPTMLQGSESNIQLLLGHYAHSMGCFRESALHFMQASKVTKSDGLRAMCQVNAAVSYICLDDPDSSSIALDLVAPVYRNIDRYLGVREQTLVLFATGILQKKQHNLQEARTRLATGLKITHKQLGNHQLVSQYLTVLGSLAIEMHDTTQARDILKSSFTLAKSLRDIPTQVTVLSELRAMFRDAGEAGKETEHAEAEGKKLEELHRRIEEAQATPYHAPLLQYGLYR